MNTTTTQQMNHQAQTFEELARGAQRGGQELTSPVPMEVELEAPADIEREHVGLVTMDTTRAEIDIQIATAHKYPRVLARVLTNALSMATLDIDTAASCYYSLPPRKGGDGRKIEGPSIRLAEVFASAWGNLRVWVRIVQETDEYIVVVAMAHDLETNLAVMSEVRRSISGKKGKFSPDMVTMTANAAQSLALRNAIFRVVPRAYINRIAKEAMRAAVGDSKTLVARRAHALEWFGKAGVTREQVLAKLGRASLDEVDLKDIETLLGLSSAIREHVTTVEAEFPTEVKASKGVDALRAIAKPAPKAAPEPAPTQTAETQAIAELAARQGIAPAPTVPTSTEKAVDAPPLTPAVQHNPVTGEVTDPPVLCSAIDCPRTSVLKDQYGFWCSVHQTMKPLDKKDSVRPGK